MLLHLFDHAVYISIELPFELSRGIIHLKRDNLPMHGRLFFSHITRWLMPFVVSLGSSYDMVVGLDASSSVGISGGWDRFSMDRKDRMVLNPFCSG